jgi:hypothetical protein
MKKRTQERRVEMITGTFVTGWAEYKAPKSVAITDSKGRLLRTENLPGKIVTRLLVELEDGQCVPVNGEHFEALATASIPIPIKTGFPGKLKEVNKVASSAYKKGEEVKLRKVTFSDRPDVIYDEVE